MIAPTSAEDARYVAENLRDEEICVRLHGREEASRIAFECATTSPLSWVVYSAMGEPVCMFGADGEKGEAWGSAWMFSTRNVCKSAKSLIWGVMTAIEYSRGWWPELRINAEPRDEKQTRFLAFIGFKERARHVRGELEYVELYS